MSHPVSCPNCGHTFNVCNDFEVYENIVADIVNGELSPERTAHYDVIDKNGITYQVKHVATQHRSLNQQNRRNDVWRWQFPDRKVNINADFFVLFVQDRGIMFLLDKSVAKNKFHKYGKYASISSTVGCGAWIWDYKVTPETFIKKRDELIRTQQLSLLIDSSINNSAN